MKKSVHKRILSGILAAMMIVSNANVATYASESVQISQEAQNSGTEGSGESSGSQEIMSISEDDLSGDEASGTEGTGNGTQSDSSQSGSAQQSSESSDKDQTDSGSTGSDLSNTGSAADNTTSQSGTDKTSTDKTGTEQSSSDHAQSGSAASSGNTGSSSSASSGSTSSEQSSAGKTTQTGDSKESKDTSAADTEKASTSGTSDKDQLTNKEKTTDKESLTKSPKDQLTNKETDSKTNSAGKAQTKESSSKADTTPVDLSQQESENGTYTVDNWWILVEKDSENEDGESTDGESAESASDSDSDDGTVTEVKQSVTGTEKRISSSNDNTSGKTTSDQTSDGENDGNESAKTENTDSDGKSQSSDNASRADGTLSEENSEQNSGEDSSKEKVIEVYNFGEYNYAPSMTLGFDITFSLSKDYTTEEYVTVDSESTSESTESSENSENSKTSEEPKETNGSSTDSSESNTDDNSGKEQSDDAAASGKYVQVTKSAKSSDYITFTLPSELKELQAETPDGAYYTCKTQSEDSGDSKVTVTLGDNIPDAETLTGKIHITFTMDNEALEAGEGICDLEILGKDYRLSFVGDDTEAIEEIDNGVSTFKISGSIGLDETLGGINWKDVVRPAVFSLPIQLVQKYTDTNENEHENVITTQDNDSSKEYYLKFENDGNGGGNFTIENVPKAVTVKEKTKTDGVESEVQKTYTVTSYQVKVDTSALSYYTSKEDSWPTITDLDGKTQAAITLNLKLQDQTLTLQPTVSPADTSDQTNFTFKTVFSNSNKIDEKAISSKTIEKTYSVAAGQTTSITVPVGIDYKVTQESKDGYRLDSNYSKTEGQSNPTTQKGSATGTIPSNNSTVTITTTNYNQNKTYAFEVNWIDNANKNRPTVSQDNFTLQYRTAASDGTNAGKWTTLDENQYSALNIDSANAPAYDATSSETDNLYYYRRLPAANANGVTLEYRVVPKAPDGYVARTSTDENGRQVITFEEQTTFKASIKWNDDSNKTGDRPKETESSSILSSLKLYRRIGTGDYTEVTDENGKSVLTSDVLTGTNSNTWSINVTGLPRYNADNQEYDYVLVQGSIGENNTVTHSEVSNKYKSYYDNATSSYGNDTTLCHNGGSITEVLYDSVDFTANKVWKDPNGTESDRPTATVTLWRYTKSEADGIDDAYNKNKAAQVVFQTTDGAGNTTEHIVSYQISNTENSTIYFNKNNVANLPENYSFPKYDDHGREYVYFVRETLTGDTADEYEIQYTSSTTGEGEDARTDSYTNGAPTGGTITNVRRKKEAVTITKIWQNPSGLSGINGVSVRTEIQASADTSKTYDTLTVYSEEQGSYKELTDTDSSKNKTTAQTITGFTSTIAQSEVTYYVNTCDDEGKPYDMTNARIVETVTGADGTVWTSTSVGNGNDSTKTVIDSNGNEYSVSTSYKETSTLAGGMKQYRYTQTNTITATRNYELVKEWDKSISDKEISKISSIKFYLERRSTKVNADGTQAGYVEVPSSESDGLWIVNASKDSRTWALNITNLPKYDSEGYEYYYRASEVSFVTTDGTTITTQAARNDEERQWSQTYYRTPDQTKVVNHKKGEGSGFFTVSKLWQDNGDTEKRGDVVIRVYRRDQLKDALENATTYGTNNIVDLDSLKLNDETNLQHYDVTLKESDQYTAYVYYNKITETLGSSTTDTDTDTDTDANADDSSSANLSLKDYVVFEYQVGNAENGATAGEYTYGDLQNAASQSDSYSLTGTVANNDRQYQATASANASDGTLTITNTRIGVTSLKVSKTWNDENNAGGHRDASIQFQIYRNGEAYTNIPDGVTVTALAVQSTTTEDTSGQSTDQNSNQNADTKSTGNGGSGWQMIADTDAPSCTVGLDHETGIVTVSKADAENTSAQWSFTIENLDMFSATAVPYIYNMDEVADNTGSTGTTTGTKNYSYTQKKQNTVVSEDGKTQEFTFGFVNTITGTTSHVAYKYWKDASIGADSRPDLYITVSRCLKSDYEAAIKTAAGTSGTSGNSSSTVDPTIDVTKLASYEKYTDYKDLIWTREADKAETDYETGYNWKITAEDLPLYDEKGEEYIYFFTEAMNNGGKTVLGTYNSETAVKKAASGTEDVYYEVFTNTITDYMKVEGRKTWTGLSKYQTTDLPNPVITLYRTVNSGSDADAITDLQSKTDEEIVQLITGGKITKVDSTYLTGSTGSESEENDKTAYSFPNTTGLDTETNKTVTADSLNTKVASGLLCKDSDGNYMLPKFDAAGNRYTYLVRETIAGAVASQLYNEINTNGTLSNTFKMNVNRRKITVTKKWDRTSVSSDVNEDQYPSVTFTLYRYEAGKETTTTTKIDSHTINSNEFKSTNDDGTKKSASYTFEDLLVYSPAGAQYFYYITEDKISGYTVTYNDEEGITTTDKTKSLQGKTVQTGTNADGTQGTLTITQDILDSLKNNQRIDVISLPENWNTDAAENDTSVSTTNTYEKKDTVTISGSKVWNDYHNFAGLRPTSAGEGGLQVTLTRYTNNEKNQNNKVNKTTIDLKDLTNKTQEERNEEEDPYIVWNYGANTETGVTAANSDQWTYTIYNLPKYAANGMSYIYILSEDTVSDGYKDKASAKVDSAKKPNTAGIVENGNMTNQYSGSYTVRKNWYDGGNKYGLRPDEVTIVLQRATSTDSGTTWSDYSSIPLETNQVGTRAKDDKGNEIAKNTWTGGYPSVTSDADGKSIISIKLTSADVVANTDGKSWEYTFQNLPLEGMENGQKVQYRYQCVETEIGGIPVTKNAAGDDTAGAYTRADETKDEDRDKKTTISNTLTSKTELTVTKTWDQEINSDQDDYYYSRPDSITFELQQKSSKEGSAWTTVTVKNAQNEEKAYQFTITKKDGWTTTLKDLPGIEIVTETDADDNTTHTQYSISYRAVEVHKAVTDSADSSTIVNDAQNYQDTTDYDTATSSTDEKQSQTITNQLIVDDNLKTITVTKNWHKGTDTAVQTATFELLYKKANDSNDTWHCYAGITVPADDGDWSNHDSTENNGTDGKHHCRVKTLSSDAAEGKNTVNWTNLPKYDLEGNELTYKVVEHPVEGYTIYSTSTKPTGHKNDANAYATSYTFTNVENQTYTVKKIWDIPAGAAAYAEKNNGEFTAVFKLQQMVVTNGTTGGDGSTGNTGSNNTSNSVNNENAGTWTDVQGTDSTKAGYVKKYQNITLTRTKSNVTTAVTGTWKNLPKYTTDGSQIVYRAVEIQINGKNVDQTKVTNGAYMVSYRYGNGADTDLTDSYQFGDTTTTVTNRMIYGFVNLGKKAAYLANGGITADETNGSLQGVTFNIYKGTNPSAATLYVSGVTTDANGNLVNNGGKYGTEQKYLVAGTYTLKEASTPEATGYSVWSNGISFTVGSNGNTNVLEKVTGATSDTGEHGTAWISTTGIGSFVLGLNVQYKPATDASGDVITAHALDATDTCTAYGTTAETDNAGAAYDIESRGVLSFTKFGENNSTGGYETLDVHSGATGESTAYFGVYTDEDCTRQVAGMVPKATLVTGSSSEPTEDAWRQMVLTNKAQDGTELNVSKRVTVNAASTNGTTGDSSTGNTGSADGSSSTKTYSIPYLRENGVSGTTADYPYTLLAGTYYIKELTAPAGYRLDSVVRKVVVKELQIAADGMTDLTNAYVDNKATITLASGSGSTSTTYQWSNNPTKVTLYKLDQFGQKVSLSTNGYLTLAIHNDEEESNTFPNGATVIQLYQSASAPTKWINNSQEITTAVNNYITYDETNGCWTIEGLLEAGKTYTLSEPVASADADHNVAASIAFTVNADGTISVPSTTEEIGATIIASQLPLTANGTDNDQKNCYKSDAANNQIVMRDTTNYLKDVVLQKEDSTKTENAGIANISFKLYKYTSRNEKGEPIDAVDVLGTNDGKPIYLTTDANGKIQLSNLDAATYKNQTINDPKSSTGSKLALKYGLAIGHYYLEEVESGATDQYRLADRLYFDIEQDTAKTSADSYNEYAKVTLTGTTKDDTAHVSVATGADVNGGVTTITLKNDPVHEKALVLTKVDSANAENKLAGAQFTLTYTSATSGQAGAQEGWTKTYITGTDGVLYLADADGKATGNQPDISAKGNYVLKENKAADGYMTREDAAGDGTATGTGENANTGDASGTGLTVLTFTVDSNNQITNVQCYDSTTGTLVAADKTASDGMVTASVTMTQEGGAAGEHQNLTVTVKNETTRVSAQIFSDIAKNGAQKSCDQKDLEGEDLTGTHLEIYEGTATGEAAAANRKATLSGEGQNAWNWTNASTGEAGEGSYLPAGTLKENTLYTLHESGAPIGYMAGSDIYFMLSGTTTQQNAEGVAEIVSQIYVWIGSSTPSAENAADMNVADTTKWSKVTNVKDNTLTMVDEAIIAPVDLQKVLASVDAADSSTSYTALKGAEFEVAVAGTTQNANAGADAENGKDAQASGSAASGSIVLGTAVTTKDGYLVWKSITEAGYNYKRIFNAEGTRVTAVNSDTAIGQTIILQQNAEGYTFTEVSAPDNAYNDGRSYKVNITQDNYLDYRTVTGTGASKVVTYNTDRFINLVAASANTTGDAPYTVAKGALSTRETKTQYDSPDGLAVNKTYQSIVTLHKYDADEEGQKAAVPGTEFTLYRVTTSSAAEGTEGTGNTDSTGTSEKSENTVYTKAYTVIKEGDSQKTTLNEKGVFTTDANGDITIEIREKGTYILKETKAAAGYELDETNSLAFTLKDQAENQKADKADAADGQNSNQSAEESVKAAGVPVYGYGITTANVLQKDESGVPNSRRKGTATLTKTDAGNGEGLNGVVYTLTRTDVPKDAKGNDLTEYLLKEPAEVVTGKCYKAVEKDGKWQLQEITAEEADKATAETKTDQSAKTTGSSSNGSITIVGLNWGTYTMTETTENSGYRMDLNADGKSVNTHTFTVNGKSTNDKGECDALTFTFADTNTKNSVTISKTNLTTKSTKENAQAAAAGNGTTAANAGTSAESSVQQSTAAQTKGLAGAEFVVYEDDGNGGVKKDAAGNAVKIAFYASADAKKTVDTITTGADGKVTIYGLPTNTAEKAGTRTYHLVETKAPAGYELQKEHVIFTVDRQGKVQVKAADGSYADADLVTMQDEVIEIWVQKVGENGKDPLTGAEFTLKDVCGDKADTYDEAKVSGVSGCDHQLANKADSESIKVTAKDGKVMIPAERLIGGHSYTLTETAAPAGYTGGASVTFHVAEDGTIDAIRSDGCASLDEDKTTIVIKNTKIPASSESSSESAGGAPGKADETTTAAAAKKQTTAQQYQNMNAGTAEDAENAAGDSEAAGASNGVVGNAKRTGDSQTPLIWIALILGAVLVIAAVETYDRRRRKDQ